MPWIGPVIGGGLSLFGSMNAADAYSNAANNAASSSKFTPYNVYSGFGSGTFDAGSPGTSGSGGYWSGGTYSSDGLGRSPEHGGATAGGGFGGGVWNPGTPGTPARPASATASLNPQYQALRDQYLRQANGNLSAFSSYDPQSASQDIYGKLSALSAPQEQQDRQNLESRLLAQGMLGSTGGGIQQQALGTAQGQTRLARELQSYTTAQDTLDRMQARGINATNAASGLDSLAMQNLNLGGVFGGRQSAANSFGAGLQFQAAGAGAGASASFWQGLGQQVAPAISNYMNPPLGYGYNNNGFNMSPYYNGNAFNAGPNAYSSGGGFGQGAFNYGA